ncbi:MAG: tyrosine-protein phosphatase [Rickettsiales bacterium]
MPEAPKRRRRFVLRWVLRALLVPLALGLYLGGLQYSDNFHEVVPGELYRSAQPEGNAIAQYSQQYGIRTILNLRGENAKSPWYQNELAASEKAGIKHLNFRMSSKRELTEAQAAQLIAIMRDAPKPLWIHCRGGADRSGLAAALYLAALKHEDAATASHQLSLRYGHLSAFGLNNTVAMDRTFEALAPRLISQKQAEALPNYSVSK